MRGPDRHTPREETTRALDDLAPATGTGYAARKRQAAIWVTSSTAARPRRHLRSADQTPLPTSTTPIANATAPANILARAPNQARHSGSNQQPGDSEHRDADPKADTHHQLAPNCCACPRTREPHHNGS